MSQRFFKPLMGAILGAVVVPVLAASIALAADPVLYAGAKGQGFLAAKSEAPDDFVEPFGPDFNKVDTKRNVWGEQTVKPPSGLTLVQEGPHVGEMLYERSKNSFGKVSGLLVDPATGLVHYLVVTSRFFLEAKRHLPVPRTAIDIDGDKVLKVATPLKSLKLLDVYSKEQLDAAYPPQKLSGAPASPQLVFMMASR
ncbi:MAG: PRC-barrel domain-containing protein [Alphaproteobacteria bacterium]|nr:PRC-barrel domain-containing protein [Alphaproteobacteria bacterium]